MFWAGRTQNCIQMIFVFFCSASLMRLVWSCQATVAQNEIQAISFNCSDSLKIYYDSTIKWFRGSSIKSKQTGEKVLQSIFVSLFLPSFYLLTTSIDCSFFPDLMLPIPCHCSSSSLCACALCECACGSWSGLHASERCLGLILGYSWRESKIEGERAGSLHHVNMVLKVPEHHEGTL